jgi:lysophospholipid acyltransferase (LPLAT)-like uncharacterized protein
VSYTTKFLGLKTIRGSSKKARSQKDKGGLAAMRHMNDALSSGACVVMTPDGPRGPRQRLGYGPIRLARLSGAPILPCTFAVKNRILFKSWDRFVLPLPFGRGQIIWGTPVIIPSEASDDDMDMFRRQIEDEMNTFLRRADMALGHDAIDPDKKEAT